MANQTPTRRPNFVTQRDGSSLANSNCRMASICMGLDYHTGGSKTATASKMRTYTSDQSGGTDSGDAKEAWDRGYDQSLDVEDGKTFSDAIASLREGRVVHLDVWHASMNDGCISGSGAYGHTIAVLPDYNGEWMVGDPWCQETSSNTDGWLRVPESKLKAGAEEWGRRVYGAAAMEADWPTAGPDLRAAIIRRIVKRLMDRSYPGHEEPIDDFPDTGGAQPILFTRTKAQPLEGEVAGLDELRSGAGRHYHNPGRDHFDKPNGTKSGDLGDGVYDVAAIYEDDAGVKWYLLNGGGEGLMRWVKA